MTEIKYLKFKLIHNTFLRVMTRGGLVIFFDPGRIMNQIDH